MCVFTRSDPQRFPSACPSNKAVCPGRIPPTVAAVLISRRQRVFLSHPLSIRLDPFLSKCLRAPLILNVSTIAGRMDTHSLRGLSIKFRIFKYTSVQWKKFLMLSQEVGIDSYLSSSLDGKSVQFGWETSSGQFSSVS